MKDSFCIVNFNYALSLTDDNLITLITIVSLLESKCLRNKLNFYHFILLISNFIIYLILLILFIFIFIIQSCKYISKLVDSFNR